MKIHFLTDIQDCVDGHNPIIVDESGIDIDVPDNSVESILLTGALEQIPYNRLQDSLVKVRKFLRLGGKVFISGIDANCLSRDLINRVAKIEEFNQALYTRKSIHDVKDMTDKLLALGLQIDKVTLKGALYEIYASRNS
jgi:predicted SAM-dependent methyltransferase